jgi:hypothetical protein
MQEVNASDVFDTPDEIELEIEQFKEMLKTKEALDRLLENEDYKRIVELLYFEEEGKRLQGLITSKNIACMRDRQYIIEDLVAIGSFEAFITGLQTRLDGIDSPENIKAMNEHIEEMREESLNEAL